MTRNALVGSSGLLVGMLAGAAVVLLAGAAVAHRIAATPQPLLEATHLSPLLTAQGEPVELRYDIYCQAPDEDPESGARCDASGSVFVRPGDSGPFQNIRLRADQAATEGRYVAALPKEIAGAPDGFSYYAVLRSNTSGAVVTLPAGGAAAPQRSLRLKRTVDVRLGAHTFGAVRKADHRVLEAAWGERPGEVGLEQGRNLPPIGGSTFDVDRNGTIYVLDEAHRRLLRWSKGTRTPDGQPLAIDGTLADMSLAPDGTIYVLESGSADRPLLVRIFTPNGQAKGTVELAAQTASQVRIGPRGPVVLQHPSGQWMPAVLEGRPLDPPGQAAAGRAGRPLPGGDEVVVLRRGNEIRSALVGANGVRRAWRVTSDTPLAEVQLAEPLGGNFVLVARVYTEKRDEFVVLLLDAAGVVQQFSVDAADWAETAPLSRFRLVGSSLYRLGSTPAGLFVDRFDLEVKR